MYNHNEIKQWESCARISTTQAVPLRFQYGVSFWGGVSYAADFLAINTKTLYL